MQSPSSNGSLSAPQFNHTPTPRKPSSYRHDPYTVRGKVFFFDDDEGCDAAAAYVPQYDEPSCPPEGTRHTSLWGRVSFVPYPTTEFRPPMVEAKDEDLVRVFVGQLPYFVTDMQLAWLCHTFGGGSAVLYPERIMKRQPSGERLPTGCIHAYATPEAVEIMAAGMHKRMLVDDTGVWHAQTHEEFEVLKAYIAVMKVDKKARVPNRPYDSVVVQLAVSTFVPVCPMPVSEMPAERGAAKKRAKAAAAKAATEDSKVSPQPSPAVTPERRASPPPPPYVAVDYNQFGFY